MKNFDYEKAYFVQALPALNGLNEKQKEAHRLLCSLVGDLNQGEDLNIPLTDEMKEILEPLTCHEIAELSRCSYFVGHWKPGHVAPVFENSKGQSWKVTNICDQVLRSTLQTPHNVLIHEGAFRVTFSSKACWMWDEFGLATERNLEIFKTCGLPFGESTIMSSAKKLTDLCGDLWGDVDEMPGNGEYNAFLLLKKEKALDDLKKKQAKRLADIEKDIENSKVELAAFQWLIEHNIPEYFIDNCIYYAHTGKFCFGWRRRMDEKEKESLPGLLVGFPYAWEIKDPRQ